MPSLTLSIADLGRRTPFLVATGAKLALSGPCHVKAALRNFYWRSHCDNDWMIFGTAPVLGHLLNDIAMGRTPEIQDPDFR